MCFNPESFNAINIVMDAGGRERGRAQETQERSILVLRPRRYIYVPRKSKQSYSVAKQKKLVSPKCGEVCTKITPSCPKTQVHCSSNYYDDAMGLEPLLYPLLPINVSRDTALGPVPFMEWERGVWVVWL